MYWERPLEGGRGLLAAKCSNPFQNMSWLKLSELVKNFKKACSHTGLSSKYFSCSLQPALPSLFGSHFSTSILNTPPVRVWEHCYNITPSVWVTLPIHSPGTSTYAWTQNKHNCCRCHHSKFKNLQGGMAQDHIPLPPPPPPY